MGGRGDGGGGGVEREGEEGKEYCQLLRVAQVIVNTMPWHSLRYPTYGAQVTHCECDDARLWDLDNIKIIHFTAGLKYLLSLYISSLLLRLSFSLLPLPFLSTFSSSFLLSTLPPPLPFFFKKNCPLQKTTKAVGLR